MGSNANADVDKLITFGKMALEQGWHSEAREYFQQALALDASNREAMKRLARANEILTRTTAVPVEPIQDELAEPPVKVERKQAVAKREIERQTSSLMEWFGGLTETGKIIVIAGFLIMLVCCWGVIFGEQEQTGTTTWQQSKTTSYKGVRVGMPADDVLNVWGQGSGGTELVGRDAEGLIVKCFYEDATLIMKRWEMGGIYCHRVAEIRLRQSRRADVGRN